jgi:hypothetical protein
MRLAFFKWRTTCFILNQFPFATCAYLQSEFAKFHVWRASRKSGGLIGPWFFPLTKRTKKLTIGKALLFSRRASITPSGGKGRRKLRPFAGPATFALLPTWTYSCVSAVLSLEGSIL